MKTAERRDAGAPPLRPFLKWAGGKRQLLAAIRPHYPGRFGRYWEPFLGSGAVFFDLCQQRRLQPGRVTLVDANPDLIACYTALRDSPEAVIEALRGLERRHRRDGAACFYEVRRRFNLDRAAAGAGGAAGLAAMLIYLNRTAFNGLYRLNAQGSFNVPAGRYANPRICDEANLRAAGAALARLGVDLRHGSYDDALREAEAGDFVYLDPPYAPLSATAAFRSYTAAGFTSADQERLQHVVLQLAARGCAVVLSNSAAPEIVRLYTHSAEARRAGVQVTRVKARRAINSRASARGQIDELLITAGGSGR